MGAVIGVAACSKAAGRGQRGVARRTHDRLGRQEIFLSSARWRMRDLLLDHRRVPRWPISNPHQASPRKKAERIAIDHRVRDVVCRSATYRLKGLDLE